MEKRDYNLRGTIGHAFYASLPIMAGYLLLGTGFGILFNAKGYGLIWVFGMSASVYAGTLQYVAVDLISGGASIITMALTSLMVNARHLFYAISMLDTYRKVDRGKPYVVFALTDEVYSLVCTLETDEMPEGVSKNRYALFLSMFCQSYWIIGSMIGAILGATLPYDFEGIDFVLTALFVAVVVEQWLTMKNHVSAITGFLASIGCLLTFGPEKFLIPTMIAITLAVTVERKLGLLDDRKEETDV